MADNIEPVVTDSASSKRKSEDTSTESATDGSQDDDSVIDDLIDNFTRWSIFDVARMQATLRLQSSGEATPARKSGDIFVADLSAPHIKAKPKAVSDAVSTNRPPLHTSAASSAIVRDYVAPPLISLGDEVTATPPTHAKKAKQ